MGYCLIGKRSRIILVVYYGHEGGSEELDLVTNYTQALPQDVYSVLRYEFINQKISHLFFSVLKEIREHDRIAQQSDHVLFICFVTLSIHHHEYEPLDHSISTNAHHVSP